MPPAPTTLFGIPWIGLRLRSSQRSRGARPISNTSTIAAGKACRPLSQPSGVKCAMVWERHITNPGHCGWVGRAARSPTKMADSHHVKNAYVADLALFPTVGSANPAHTGPQGSGGDPVGYRPANPLGLGKTQSYTPSRVRVAPRRARLGNHLSSGIQVPMSPRRMACHRCFTACSKCWKRSD